MISSPPHLYWGGQGSCFPSLCCDHCLLALKGFSMLLLKTLLCSDRLTSLFCFLNKVRITKENKIEHCQSNYRHYIGNEITTFGVAIEFINYRLLQAARGKIKLGEGLKNLIPDSVFFFVCSSEQKFAFFSFRTIFLLNIYFDFKYPTPVRLYLFQRMRPHYGIKSKT